jgi:hypothetical protein
MQAAGKARIKLAQVFISVAVLKLGVARDLRRGKRFIKAAGVCGVSQDLWESFFLVGDCKICGIRQMFWKVGEMVGQGMVREE